MSTTRRTRKQITSFVESDTESVHDSDAKAARTKAKGKGKATTKKKKSNANPFSKVKGRTGVLSKISEMPLDVLVEICQHVDHETLFTLSITLKVFREVLLSPFANSLWVNAREEAKLPELAAADMTESQYAHLIWGRACQACGKKGISKTNYILRLRMCPKCLKSNVVNARMMPDDIPDVHQLTYRCCVFSYSKHSGKEFNIESFRSMNALIHSKFFSKNQKEMDFWHEDQLDIGLLWDTDDEDYQVPAGPPTEKFVFTKDRADYISKRMADGSALEYWLDKHKASKEDTKDEIRHERRAEIEKRLKEEENHDWNDSDFDDFHWRNAKLVSQAKPITNLIWKNLAPKLYPILLERRTIRSQQKRRRLLIRRRKALINEVRSLFVDSEETKYFNSDSDSEFDSSEEEFDYFGYGRRKSKPPKPYFQIPSRVFLTLPSVRPLWESENSDEIDSSDLDAELLIKIGEEVEEVKKEIYRAFFELLLQTQGETIAKHPSLDISPIAIVNRSSPTLDEINSTITDFPKIINCTSCVKTYTFPEFINHHDTCDIFGRRDDDDTPAADIEYDGKKILEVASGKLDGYKLVTSASWVVLTGMRNLLKEKEAKEKEEKEEKETVKEDEEGVRATGSGAVKEKGKAKAKHDEDIKINEATLSVANANAFSAEASTSKAQVGSTAQDDINDILEHLAKEEAKAVGGYFYCHREDRGCNPTTAYDFASAFRHVTAYHYFGSGSEEDPSAIKLSLEPGQLREVPRWESMFDLYPTSDEDSSDYGW